MDLPSVTEIPAAYNKQRQIKKLSGFVSYAFGGLEILLLIRFIFRFLGASANNAFVNLLYQATFPFVGSFAGIFGRSPSLGVSTIEMETIIAAVIFGLIWFGLVQLIKTLLE